MCPSHTSLLLFKFLVKYFFVLLCLNNPKVWRYDATATRHRMQWVAQIMAFTLYPGLSTVMFSIFVCREINHQYYLVADMSVVCFDDKWYRYAVVAVVGICIYSLG